MLFLCYFTNSALPNNYITDVDSSIVINTISLLYVSQQAGKVSVWLRPKPVD